MNELLGWYGYDKVELRDSEANEMRNYRERRQHVSVLKGKGPRVEGPPTGRLLLKRSSFHRLDNNRLLSPEASPASFSQMLVTFLGASAPTDSGGHSYMSSGVFKTPDCLWF